MIKKSNVPFRCWRTITDRGFGRVGCVAVMVVLVLRPLAHAAPDANASYGAEDSKRGKSELTPADNAEDLSLPYSRILRNTEPVYGDFYQDARARTRFAENETIGPVNVRMQGSLLGGGIVSIHPDDAEFKFGRFYLDLRSVSASMLYSDNVDLSEDNRRGDVIGIVRMSAAALYEVSDSIHLGVQGTLVYLPFENQIGIAGFGIYDPLLAFQAAPVFLTELTLEENVGKWDVQIFDEFRVQVQQFGADAGLNDLERFDAEDRAGVYGYSDHSRYVDRNSQTRDYTEGRNLVGGSASRLLPTETRFEFGGDHANYYYYGDVDEDLPSSRERVYALLASERETLRFKPFVRYEAWTYDNSDGWSEEARGGVHGPITENLHLLADLGYYWRTDSSHTSYVGQLRLRHTINPLTYQQVAFYRGTTEPIEEIESSASYRLHHLFRPDLSGDLYGSIAKYESVDTGGRTGEERRAATRFTYNLAQRTILRLSGAYLDFRDDDSGTGNSDTGDYSEWVGRGEVIYLNTATVQTRLIYQYRDRHADRPGDSYWENLVILTVIKYF